MLLKMRRNIFAVLERLCCAIFSLNPGGDGLRDAEGQTEAAVPIDYVLPVPAAQHEAHANTTVLGVRESSPGCAHIVCFSTGEGVT